VIELLGTVAVVAGFGGTAIWLAVSRGNAQRRADRLEAQLTALSREYAAYHRHVEQQLEAQEVTIDAYDSMLDMDGGASDPRNIVAALSRGVLSRPAEADDSAEDLSTDAGSTGHPTPSAELLGPHRGLLGRDPGEGAGPVDGEGNSVDT